MHSLGSSTGFFVLYQADIILWDYHLRDIYCKLTLHRNNVEALAFSPSDTYLVSLGGQDDGRLLSTAIRSKSHSKTSPKVVESG